MQSKDRHCKADDGSNRDRGSGQQVERLLRQVVQLFGVVHAGIAEPELGNETGNEAGLDRHGPIRRHVAEVIVDEGGKQGACSNRENVTESDEVTRDCGRGPVRGPPCARCVGRCGRRNGCRWGAHCHSPVFPAFMPVIFNRVCSCVWVSRVRCLSAGRGSDVPSGHAALRPGGPCEGQGMARRRSVRTLVCSARTSGST